MRVPFLNLERLHADLDAELSEAFSKVLAKQAFIKGSEVDGFEREFATWTTSDFAIGTSNGLDALTLALRSLNVGPGDQVVMPANTFIATALAVSQLGAQPVLVDVCPDTALMNPVKLHDALGPSTKVVVPVHLYGQACGMTSISELARACGASIVEDNAQAQGASWDGKFTGSWGDLSATSFYPGKNLGALGDAGAVTTSQRHLAQKVRELGNYGSLEKYNHTSKGANMRLDELQAAFLRVKLPHLHRWNEMRQTVAARYGELLSDVAEITLPWTDPEATHVYHLYVVVSPKRDELASWLDACGVSTLVHYPKCIHEHKAYQELNHMAGGFPVSERLARQSLSLPMHPFLTSSEQEYVAESIKRFFGRQS